MTANTNSLKEMFYKNKFYYRTILGLGLDRTVLKALNVENIRNFVYLN